MKTMNKKLVVVGLVLVAVAKILILKFVLFDLPAYDKCTAIDSSISSGFGGQGCTEVCPSCRSS